MELTQTKILELEARLDSLDTHIKKHEEILHQIIKNCLVLGGTVVKLDHDIRWLQAENSLKYRKDYPYDF